MMCLFGMSCLLRDALLCFLLTASRSFADNSILGAPLQKNSRGRQQQHLQDGATESEMIRIRIQETSNSSASLTVSYQPGFWVHVFSKLGFQAAFPTGHASNFHWAQYLFLQAIVPLLLLFGGFSWATVLVIARWRQPTEDKEIFIVGKPNAMPLVCTVTLSVVILVVGCGFILHNLDIGFSRAGELAGRMHHDLWHANSEASSLQNAVANGLRNLVLVDSCCPAKSWRTYAQHVSCMRSVPPIQHTLIQALSQLQGPVAQFATVLGDAVPVLAQTHDGLADLYDITTTLFVSPIALTALLMTFTALVAIPAAHSSNTRCKACLKKVVGLNITNAILIIIVVFACAWGLGLGIALGNICADPSTNILDMIQVVANKTNTESFVHVANATNLTDTAEYLNSTEPAGTATSKINMWMLVYDLFHFWLTGEGANPLDKYLHMGKTYVGMADTVVSSSAYYALFALFKDGKCEPLTAADIRGITAQTKETIELTDAMASRSQFFSYYDEALELTCGSCVHSLGWLILCMLLTVLVALPCVGRLAQDLLMRSIQTEQHNDTRLKSFSPGSRESEKIADVDDSTPAESFGLLSSSRFGDCSESEESPQQHKLRLRISDGCNVS